MNLSDLIERLKVLDREATKGPMVNTSYALEHHVVETTTQHPDLHWNGKSSIIGGFYYRNDTLLFIELRNALPLIIKSLEVTAAAVEQNKALDDGGLYMEATDATEQAAREFQAMMEAGK